MKKIIFLFLIGMFVFSSFSFSTFDKVMSHITMCGGTKFAEAVLPTLNVDMQYTDLMSMKKSEIHNLVYYAPQLKKGYYSETAKRYLSRSSIKNIMWGNLECYGCGHARGKDSADDPHIDEPLCAPCKHLESASQPKAAAEPVSQSQAAAEPSAAPRKPTPKDLAGHTREILRQEKKCYCCDKMKDLCVAGEHNRNICPDCMETCNVCDAPLLENCNKNKPRHECNTCPQCLLQGR